MDKYSAKLTGEPFLYNETKIIAKHILLGEDIDILKQRNIKENLIMYKSPNAIVRVNSPIFRRISVFNDSMLDVFVNGDLESSKLLLLYSIMKTDNLVRDFVIEVYREHILNLKSTIEKYEINNWFEKIYADSNLCNISDSTKYKLKQVTLKIMVDSGILQKKENMFNIIIPILTDKFKKLLIDSGDIKYVSWIGGTLWKV